MLKIFIIKGCGGVLTSPEGSIVSPGYPSSYGENAECIWRIEVSHGSRVLFAFVDLDMESQPSGCAFDYVEVSTSSLLIETSSL
jgi:cubilin